MTYIQARRLANMMTPRQLREIQFLAQVAREQGTTAGNCERFDPMTASCAPTCAICSHRGRDCFGGGNGSVEFRISDR